MGGTERAIGITKAKLTLKIQPDDVMDAIFMRVKAIVTEVKSYDVLVRASVLNSIGFILDFGRDNLLSTMMASKRWTERLITSSIYLSLY